MEKRIGKDVWGGALQVGTARQILLYC